MIVFLSALGEVANEIDAREIQRWVDDQPALAQLLDPLIAKRCSREPVAERQLIEKSNTNTHQ